MNKDVVGLAEGDELGLREVGMELDLAGEGRRKRRQGVRRVFLFLKGRGRDELDSRLDLAHREEVLELGNRPVRNTDGFRLTLVVDLKRRKEKEEGSAATRRGPDSSGGEAHTASKRG